MEQVERVRQAGLGVAVLAALALGEDHHEVVRPLGALPLQELDERAAADRLVGDHERAGHVRAVGVQIHHQVLDGKAGVLPHPVDQVPP